MSKSPSAPATFGKLHKQILRQYERELRPQGPIESHLVQCIAHESLSLRVLDKAIDACLSDPAFAPRLGALTRYKANSERRFHHAIAELLRSRKQRQPAAPAAPPSRAARRAPRRRSAIAPLPPGAVG